MIRRIISIALKRKFLKRDINLQGANKPEPGINFSLGKGNSIPRLWSKIIRKCKTQGRDNTTYFSKTVSVIVVIFVVIAFSRASTPILKWI